MRYPTIRHYVVLFFAVVGATGLGMGNVALATIVADWTFESLPTSGVTSGPYTAEAGVNGATSQATGVGGATYTSPAGSLSAKSFSANGWDVSDYWQFKVPTTGFTGLTLSFDQTGSNTGPRDFKVATSPDGTTFTDLPSGGYTVLFNGPPNSAWGATGGGAAYTHSYSLPVALENVAFAFIRLIDTSTTSINGTTVAVAGSDRVDNVIISAVPEAPAVAFGLLVCCVFGVTYGGRSLWRKGQEESRA
jgi:hypothetical protein